MVGLQAPSFKFWDTSGIVSRYTRPLRHVLCWSSFEYVYSLRPFQPPSLDATVTENRIVELEMKNKWITSK